MVEILDFFPCPFPLPAEPGPGNLVDLPGGWYPPPLVVLTDLPRGPTESKIRNVLAFENQIFKNLSVF